MSKVAVICFLWGDWPDGNRGLGPMYVYKLLSGIARNSTVPFDFHVYVDKDRYVKPGLLSHLHLKPIPENYAGFRWNLKKISMFSPDAVLLDYSWVVAMDLDMIILGNIDFLLNQRSDKLITCRGAYRDAPGGSIIGFDPNASWVDSVANYLLYNKSLIEEVTQGSERFYYQRCVSCSVIEPPEYWQDLHPGKVASFKVDVWGNSSIVRFHGQPRPHDPEVMKYHKLRQNWINR